MTKNLLAFFSFTLTLCFLGIIFPCVFKVHAQSIEIDPSPHNVILKGNEVKFTVNCPEGSDTFTFTHRIDPDRTDWQEWQEDNGTGATLYQLREKPVSENSFASEIEYDDPQEVGAACFPSGEETSWIDLGVVEVPEECKESDNIEECLTSIGPTSTPPAPPCKAGYRSVCDDEGHCTHIQECTKRADGYYNCKPKMFYAPDPINTCIIAQTAVGDIGVTPEAFIISLFTIILSISGGIAVLIIIYSGYQMMMSRGNPETVTVVKDRLTAVIVGLLFLIFSLVILQVIGIDILRLPGFAP